MNPTPEPLDVRHALAQIITLATARASSANPDIVRAEQAQALHAIAERAVRASRTLDSAESAGPSVSGQPTPTAADIDAIAEKWLRQCGACDAGLSTSCVCADGDPRNVAAERDGWANTRKLLHAAITERDEARSQLAEAREQRDSLADLRRDVVMALVAEGDDEERTDEQVVARVRELVTLDRIQREINVPAENYRTHCLTSAVTVLRERGVHVNFDNLAESIRDLAAERDSLREERDRLVAEVGAIGDKLASVGSCYFGCHKAVHANADALRALAATPGGWRPAKPGDTPGTVEPDDARPQPIDAAAAPVEAPAAPPPVGEGAALIAAIEQEIDALDDISMEAATYHERVADAWEKAAHTLSAKLDEARAERDQAIDNWLTGPHGCDGLCEQAAEHGLHPPVRDECCGDCGPGLCYVDARNGEEFTGRGAEPPAAPVQPEDRPTWAALAARLRTLGLPFLGNDPTEITDRVCRWLATLHDQAATQARVIVQRSGERDEARAALATAERERDEARAERDHSRRNVHALARELTEARQEAERLRAEVQRADKLLSNLRDDVLADTVGISAISGRINLIRDELRAALGSTPDTGSTHG